MRTKSRNLTGKKVTGLLMALVMLVCAIATSLPNITARAASEYGSGTVNLMQGKSGYASSNQRGDSTVGERQVSNLTDGNTGSYIILHQDDTDPWVYGDLGAEYSVNKVVVYQGADSAYPNAYATSFTVEYTTNLSTGWKTAATVTGARMGSNTVTFSPVTARYIRIHVQQKYATNASFLELQVYQTDYNKAPGTDTEPLRILFIGNSLTDYNNVAGKVKDLFTASGQEVETQTLIQLGKSLTYHASLPETSTTILNGDFDYVVMQDKASGFNGDTLKNGVTTINQWISQTGAKPVLYMPWANKSVLASTQSYFTESYISAAKSIGAQMAPAGEVWYEFFYDYGYDWYSDNIHATNTGSLVSAASIFYTITGRTAPLTFTGSESAVTNNGIDASLMNLIQERAWAYSTAYSDLNNIKNPDDMTSTNPGTGSGSGSDTPSQSGTVNLALGKTAYASSNQRGDGTIGVREVRFLTDGDTTSFIILHQDDTDPWVYTDLGTNYSVNKVDVYQGANSEYPNSYATGFTVEYSTNGSTWNTAAVCTTGVAGKNTVTFDAVTARYIRVSVENKYATNASFLELMVYEATSGGNTGGNTGETTESTESTTENVTTDKLRILFIGNSLTEYNNVSGKVKDLFTAMGREVEVEKLIQLGQTLTLHASLPVTQETILNGNFDYVVMQDKASGFNANVLRDGVNAINPWITQSGAKPVLYMPWANKSVLQTEQSNFTAGYVSVGKSINALVAPAGEVWYEFFYDYGYDWYSDNIHATNTGSLMAAATIFYTITGLDVPLTFTDADSIVATSGINAQLMNLIQERACVYAKAYRNLDNIQEPEVDVPETTIPEAASRPNLSVTDTADPSVQKVSTNATVTASSEVQSGALAVDGNSNSRWESNSTDNEWICLDLGKTCDISKVTIQWETAAGKTYDIQVSDDGVNWKTVHTVTNGQNGAYLDVDLNNASGRYVRVLGKERTTPYGYSIYEMGIYSNVDDSYFVNQNLALGKEAGASSGNGALAVDGNGESRWESTFVDNQYVYVDLGAEYRIDTVKLIWEAAYGKGYTIETSTDGSNWNVVYTENAGDGDTDNISLSDVTARFVMVYGTKRGTNYGFSLWEMEVYGGLKDAATKPEETEPSVEESSEVSTEASSEESSEETEAPSAPEVIKPVKVTGLNAVYENGKIKLTWENNGAVKYRVMRFDSINPGYTTLTYSATAGGYVDTDLIDAHRYYYRVCGYFYDAEGKLVQGSVSDSAGVVATDREPGKVENVKAVVDGRTVTLTWDAPEGVRYYKLARAYGATAAEGSYGTLKYNVEETTYTDTTIKYGGTFRYKVVGYYKAVDGSWTYGAMSDTLFLTIK